MSVIVNGGDGSATAYVFEDPKSRALHARIERLAQSDATVLLTGATGTGKEVIARYIHQLSRRSQGLFLALNCGAFSESLVESDLFGHERGAFTGALGERKGCFETADGGTLLLDEVGELSLASQVKLLRVLQEREVVRLGSHRPIPVNVRVVAATNVNLEGAVAAGRFRSDLYYRLAVAKVQIDPLRERPGDILPLARYFMDRHAARLAPSDRVNTNSPVLTTEVEECLLMHPWEGNIRELENAIQHALLVSHDGRITAQDLLLADASTLRSNGQSGAGDAPCSTSSTSLPDPRLALRRALRSLYAVGGPRLWEEIEEAVVRTAYEHADHNQLKAARLLGTTRTILRARLLRYGLLARPGAVDGRGAPPQEREPGAPSHRPRSHVLVVDDDRVTRESLGELLQDEGYEVSFAENGRGALQLLSNVRAPDVIILDLWMPVMDGWEFRAVQQEDPHLGRIPVLAMSADRSANADALSAQGYLRKPFDPSDFLRAVERTRLVRPGATGI